MKGSSYNPQARKERDWLGKTPLAYAAWQGRAEARCLLLFDKGLGFGVEGLRLRE